MRSEGSSPAWLLWCQKEARATALTPARAVAATGFPTPAVLSGEWWVGVENAPRRPRRSGAAPGPPSPALRVSLTRGPHSAPPRGPPLPAPALEPGRRRPDRSLSHTPPRRSSCPRRLPGAQPRGSRSFQPGPHFSQAGPERATRAGESRPETLLQKRPARERPPALLHTNHAGDARASPRRPTSPQQEKGVPHPQKARALQPGNPSERPLPALMDPDHGRPKGEPRHQTTTPKAPPPRSRTHENTPLLAPSRPGPVGKLPERRREVFPYGAGLHFLLKETRRDFRGKDYNMASFQWWPPGGLSQHLLKLEEFCFSGNVSVSSAFSHLLSLSCL